MSVEQFVKKYAVERKNTFSAKWDGLEETFGKEDLLAMWVADMEFKAPDEVLDALKERVDHGVFGYAQTRDTYYDAFFSWQKRRYDIDLKQEWIVFSPGIVAALYRLVNCFTKPQDKVAVMTPVYYPFFNAIEDNDRIVVKSELKNEGGLFTIDFEDLEKQIDTEDVKMLIFCSPHNPVGRVWTKDELLRVAAICKKSDVVLVSDEIHQDLIVGNKPFISMLSVIEQPENEKVICLTAASKTFNLAGLIHSHVIIPNESLKDAFNSHVEKNGHSAPNILGELATEAAYTHGEAWLDELLEVIQSNFDYLESEFEEFAPEVVVSPLEGTYLAWVDLRKYIDPEDTEDFIQNVCGIAVDYGEWFSDAFKGFIRINLGTTPENVRQAIKAIVENIHTYKK